MASFTKLQKSEEEFQLKKAEELAKAELAAAIAREKAAQIEKLGEADLHVRVMHKWKIMFVFTLSTMLKEG